MILDMLRPQPSGRFAWVQAAYGPALVCEALQPFAQHLYTTRLWTLGSSGPAAESAWAPVAAAVDAEPSRLLRLHQVHGASVVVHRAGAPLPTQRANADILVSNDPSIALAIQTADCVPLLIADTRSGAVAAAHTGWRGLAARVPAAAVDALAQAFGSRPEDLVAAVGPSISVERYEVGLDVRERFAAAAFSTAQLDRWFVPTARPDHWFFDGWQSTRDQLHSSGVNPVRIHVAALCTATFPDVFCSHRRNGTGAGRMAAVIRPIAR